MANALSVPPPAHSVLSREARIARSEHVEGRALTFIPKGWAAICRPLLAIQAARAKRTIFTWPLVLSHFELEGISLAATARLVGAKLLESVSVSYEAKWSAAPFATPHFSWSIHQDS
jgi:hypothetical protein